MASLDSLPTELLQLITLRTAQSKADKYDQPETQLCLCARISSRFTILSQALLYQNMKITGSKQAIKWLESDTTTKQRFKTKTLSLHTTITTRLAKEILKSISEGLEELHLRSSTKVYLDILTEAKFSSLKVLSTFGPIGFYSELPFLFKLDYLSIRVMKKKFAAKTLQELLLSSPRKLRWNSGWNGSETGLFTANVHLCPNLESLEFPSGELTDGVFIHLRKLASYDTWCPEDQFDRLISALSELPSPSLRFIRIATAPALISTPPVSVLPLFKLFDLPSLSKLEKISISIGSSHGAVKGLDELLAYGSTRGVNMELERLTT